MTDANSDNQTSNFNGGEQSSPSYELDGQSYPLFPFDQPVTIKLLDGTIHKFKQWSEPVEKQREDSLKSIVVTSPANVHGENPMDIKTDYTKSTLRYYALMIDEVGGIKLPNGAETNGKLFSAEMPVEGYALPNGDQAKVIDFLRVATRRAAASRLYGGKIDIEKPDEAEDADPLDYDPFNVETLDLTEEIRKAENRQQLQVLSLARTVIIRQELGIEQLPNGQITKPTHVLRYFFSDPDGDDFSRWEMKAQHGFAIPLRKGGTRAETKYNLDTVKALFDKLIQQIEGGSIAGQPVILPSDPNDKLRQTLLAQIPLLIKKNTIVQLFREANQLGNV